MTQTRRIPLLLTLLIALSALLTLTRSGPLHGSTAALLLTVALQVWLPGYLLARALGKAQHPHPIVRLAWVLLCGLALTIVLGAAARLLAVPVSHYLLLLHALLLLLAWLPPLPAPEEPAWNLTRGRLPLYLLVLLACITVMGVTLTTSRYRFFGFEDQVIFASQAGWLANDLRETPLGGPLRARQVGVLEGDSRFDTDGWTYTHGAWSWASGVNAAQIIWYHLDPLFLWTVPLAVFGLAYELTRREEAAAWSAGSLVLVGLLTLDNIVTYPNYTAFGRLAVFQLTTLRQASITLMLPLALMVGMRWLRVYQRRDLGLVALGGLMLAIMHPFQVTLFIISIGMTAALGWLVGGDKRRNLVRLLPLALVLAVLLVLPFVQRLSRFGTETARTVIDNDMGEESIQISGDASFLILPDFPLIGDTFIRRPASFFYHPAIALAAALGLLHVAGLRRSLAARYLFGATLACLLIAFTPGLTEFFNRFASRVGLLSAIFLMPVALALGISLDHAGRWLAARLRDDPAWWFSAAFAGAGVLLLFEPLPVPASARDQMQTFIEMQQFRRLLPAQAALTGRLQTLLPANRTTVLMTTPDTTSVVIEDLPRTLVTGGRMSRNQAQDGDNRFFNHAGWRVPWLDSEDIDFMNRWGVTHLIVRADHTRLPQLLFQPERFPLLDTVAGQVIFERAPVEPDDVDALFAQMNTLYAGAVQPRWGPEGFIMNRPGSPDVWEPLAAAWRDLLDTQPQDNRVRLGLAFSELMAGADDRALPLWRALHDAHPNAPLLLDALAYSLASTGQPGQGAAALLDALDSDDEAVRTLAARTLLTETFFHLLTADQIERVLAHTGSDTWAYLANFDQTDAMRRRAALLMSAQRWETAIDWLGQLPDIMQNPRDITAQAVMMLAQGDLARALDHLRPTADPDWRRARAAWGPERWADNQAERLYQVLNGDAAHAPGQAWPEGVLEVVPLTAIMESGNPFVMQPSVTVDEAESRLTVTAVYGNPQPHTGYPVQFWRIEVISPDSSIRYAAQDAGAVFVENALVRAATTLALPDDLDPLTPALVVITPAYNNAVTYTSVSVPVTLNRPDSAEPAPGYTALDYTFGSDIRLEGYTLDAADDGLRLTLYWRADTQVAEDYQVFVHVVDAAGEMLAQDDGAPVEDRYPTSQWRVGVTIADPHVIPVRNLPRDYRIFVGLYHLIDQSRLPVAPVDERVASDSLLLTSPTAR